MTERTTDVGEPLTRGALAPARRDEFVALLSSVSHDLRSPLLTIALSADLLRDAHAADDPARAEIAGDALREGVRDIERMLDAITTLSRAARRTLAPRSSLAGVVARDLLSSDGAIDADARLAADLLDALGPAATVELRERDRAFEVTATPPEDLAIDLPAGSALAALLDSLKAHAGTVVERLAAIELQATRQGGSLRIEAGRAILELPRSQPSS